MKQLKSDLDRISDLPDSLQCHILSFLPTEDAVATGFLSTKWRNIWTTISNINFNDSKIPANVNFLTFVMRVLLFHNAPSINKFSLNCQREDLTSYDPHALVTWAIQKNVRVLDVTYDLRYGDPLARTFRLPISLFTCQTLEVLQLSGNMSIKVPTKLCLPNLRRMELIQIKHYKNDKTVSNLISSCPSLESLRISRMGNDDVRTFTISSSTLKYLCIEEIVHPYEWDDLNYVIMAPDLKYLDIVTGPVISFLIENSTSLVVVDIRDSHIEYDQYDQYDDDGVLDLNSNHSRLLHGICSAQTLRLGVEIFQPLISANLFPTFDRLTVLTVEVKCCKWSLLQAFIINSENLQCLSITKVPCYQTEHVVCWRHPESVPKCLITSLRKVTFIDFGGFEDELAMAEYIVQNGRVLEKIEINTIKILSSLVDDKKKVQLLQKLLKCRASVRCEVTIS